MSDHAPDLMTQMEARLKARMPAIRADPHLASGGRLLVILDPETYGWDRVKSAVETDGMVALQMVEPVATRAAIETHFGKGVNAPEWACFTAPIAKARAQSQARIDATPLPHGWRIESLSCPDADAIAQAHALNRLCDVSTTPASFLRSEDVANVSTFLWDDAGQLAGFASGGKWYHPQGPLAGYFWAGSVSIDPAHRRMGLGALVFAHLLVDSHLSLNWTTGFAVAAKDNHASTGMIGRCGLNHVPNRVIIVLDPNGAFQTR